MVVVVVTLLEGLKWWWWCYFSRSQLVLSLTVTAFPAAGPTGYVPTGGLHHHQNNPRAHKFLLGADPPSPPYCQPDILYHCEGSQKCIFMSFS